MSLTAWSSKMSPQYPSPWAAHCWRVRASLPARPPPANRPPPTWHMPATRLLAAARRPPFAARPPTAAHRSPLAARPPFGASRPHRPQREHANLHKCKKCTLQFPTRFRSESVQKVAIVMKSVQQTTRKRLVCCNCNFFVFKSCTCNFLCVRSKSCNCNFLPVARQCEAHSRFATELTATGRVGK